MPPVVACREGGRLLDQGKIATAKLRVVILLTRLWRARQISRNMRKQSLAMLGAVVILAACTTTHLTATSPPAPSPGAPCAFQILTAPPSGGYVEVGVVNAQLGDYGSNAFSTLADFKKEIAPYVCRTGGDVAVAHANEAGIYITATVLKSTGLTPARPPPESPP